MKKEEIFGISWSDGDQLDLAHVYISMDKYAKQECIAFAKFVMGKTLQDCNTEDRWTLDDFSEVTDRQLYELYLQSKVG